MTLSLVTNVKPNASVDEALAEVNNAVKSALDKRVATDDEMHTVKQYAGLFKTIEAIMASGVQGTGREDPQVPMAFTENDGGIVRVMGSGHTMATVGLTLARGMSKAWKEVITTTGFVPLITTVKRL